MRSWYASTILMRYLQRSSSVRQRRHPKSFKVYPSSSSSARQTRTSHAAIASTPSPSGPLVSTKDHSPSTLCL